MKATDLELALNPYGLYLRGLFELNDNDQDDLTQPISKLTNKSNLAVALVGNIGSSFWPQFSSASEYTDGLPDPLDRWSKRVASQLNSTLEISALFPSDGPPYFPFQQWAKRAEGLSPSPMGLLIHPKYGLWHAYRFALVVSLDDPLTRSVASADSPCLTCIEQPCLNTCPVDAFTSDGYDISTCAEYLKHNLESDCSHQGCQARLSCPAGESYRYIDAQHLFHLSAFVSAR